MNQGEKGEKPVEIGGQKRNSKGQGGHITFKNKDSLTPSFQLGDVF